MIILNKFFILNTFYCSNFSVLKLSNWLISRKQNEVVKNLCKVNFFRKFKSDYFFSLLLSDAYKLTKRVFKIKDKMQIYFTFINFTAFES